MHAKTCALLADIMAMETENIDPELKLIEDACTYITLKEYPPSCTKDEKRSIRRKAEKLVVKDGEIFCKRQDKEVIKL